MEKWTAFVNRFFEAVNGFFAKFYFWDAAFWTEDFQIPLVALLLFTGGVFFTWKMRLVNVRLFAHALRLTFGKKASPFESPSGKSKTGEISHFKALATALSATVGLGNIAGVAVAIAVGGPGAAFWMIVMGFFGMSVKFAECSLGIMYREKRKDGRFMGGPVKYLSRGLAETGRPRLGKALAVIFALCCICGSFGGGVAFQVNQSLHAVSLTFPAFGSHTWIYGLILVLLTGAVIIGGLKRIASVSGRIVPLMCCLYVGMVLFVLISRYDQLPAAALLIFKEAFSPSSAAGGLIGVLVVGVQRAAFSNEAGLGSSPIAHSAAKANHPVEEGAVALLEPFIDTILICSMTALLIVVTGVHAAPDHAHLAAQQKGAALTSAALQSAHHWFPYLLSGIVFLFAFSTIISWSYYGERCVSFLFGEKFALPYKVTLLIVIILGATAKSTHIMDFCDLMILSMCIPNLFGVFLLSGKVKRALKEYTDALKSA